MPDEEQETLLFARSDEELSIDEQGTSDAPASFGSCIFCLRGVHNLVCCISRMCYTVFRCCRASADADASHTLPDSISEYGEDRVDDEEDDALGGDSRSGSCNERTRRDVREGAVRASNDETRARDAGGRHPSVPTNPAKANSSQKDKAAASTTGNNANTLRDTSVAVAVWKGQYHTDKASVTSVHTDGASRSTHPAGSQERGSLLQTHGSGEQQAVAIPRAGSADRCARDGQGARGRSLASASPPRSDACREERRSTSRRLAWRGDGCDGDDGDDYDLFVEAIETARAPITTLAELTSFLERCRRYLPVGLQVELDGYMNARAQHMDCRNRSSFHCESTTTATTTTTTATSAACAEATAAYTTPTMYFCLYVRGPLHILPTSSILGVVEDVLLDDCDAEVLSLSSVRCSDLDLSRQSRMSRRGVVHQRASGNDKNNICSLKDDADSDGEDDIDGVNEALRYMETECHTRMLVFVTNVMRTRERELATVWFTRCIFGPYDAGHAFPLNVRYVQRLLFEQCPLTAAHVEVFLRLAQQASTPRQESFAALQELQLSGSLTEECIADVLNYFDVELQAKPSLRVLRLPVMVCRSIQKHHFLQSHPYIDVLPNKT